jgi:hypothetical protein
VVGFCDHFNEHAVPYLASRAIISFLRTAVFSFAGLCMCVYMYASIYAGLCKNYNDVFFVLMSKEFCITVIFLTSS